VHKGSKTCINVVNITTDLFDFLYKQLDQKTLLNQAFEISAAFIYPCIETRIERGFSILALYSFSTGIGR
jgi:hypothetical protein